MGVKRLLVLVMLSAGCTTLPSATASQTVTPEPAAAPSEDPEARALLDRAIARYLDARAVAWQVETREEGAPIACGFVFASGDRFRFSFPHRMPQAAMQSFHFTSDGKRAAQWSDEVPEGFVQKLSEEEAPQYGHGMRLIAVRRGCALAIAASMSGNYLLADDERPQVVHFVKREPSVIGYQLAGTQHELWLDDELTITKRVLILAGDGATRTEVHRATEFDGEVDPNQFYIPTNELPAP